MVLMMSAAVSAQPPAQPVTVSVVQTESAPAAASPTKKLTVKQKIQKFWNKISRFDYQSLNIIGQTEKFVAGKKKQNLEAFEGAETGVWKHTKRMPTSGKAKEIADQLDKTSQEKIKKYDSIDTY